MSSCTLICDNREHAILRHATEFTSITMRQEQLTVGDYAVMDPIGGIMAIIERKSLDDYGASLKDGRHGNKAKLVEATNGTKCRIIYIIEGEAFPRQDELYSRIPYKHIESSIFHIIIRDNICVLRTANTLDTAQTLVRFVHSMDSLWAKGETVLETKDGAGVVNMDALQTKHVKTDMDVVREMFSKIPGITHTNADDYIALFSIADLVSSRVDLSTVRLKSGKPISKKPMRGLSSIDRDREIKILNVVPGISAKTARELLTGKTLRDISSYTPETLSMYRIGTRTAGSAGTSVGRQLGMGKAEKIIKMLNYKQVG